MFELKELARPVRRFAERHDARVADDSLERLEVGEVVASLRGRQANRVAAHPVNGRLVLLSEQRRDRQADQGTNEEEPTRIHLPDLAVLSPPPFLSRSEEVTDSTGKFVQDLQLERGCLGLRYWLACLLLSRRSRPTTSCPGCLPEFRSARARLWGKVNSRGFARVSIGAT